MQPNNPGLTFYHRQLTSDRHENCHEYNLIKVKLNGTVLKSLLHYFVRRVLLLLYNNYVTEHIEILNKF